MDLVKPTSLSSDHPLSLDRPKQNRPAMTPQSGEIGKPEDIRRQLLARAGITEDEQVEITRQVFQKFRDKLEAQTTKFFQTEGKVTDSRDVEAHDIQITAARELATLIGLEAPKASSSVVVHHEFEMPEWFKPTVIETEARQEIEDAEVVPHGIDKGMETVSEGKGYEEPKEEQE